MRWLKLGFDFYINSSIHVALAVYSFLRITESYFGLPYNEPLDYFVFYGTITGYNFIKYAGVAKLYHKSLKLNLRLIQLFSVISFLAMVYYATYIKLSTLFFLLPFAILTFLYAIPFIGGLKKNLRSVGYIKILVVALVWSAVTVLVPLKDLGKDWVTSRVMLMFLQRIFLVIVLVLPFDIRDLKNDSIGLQTIPRMLGLELTKRVGFVLLLLCMFLEFLIGGASNFKQSFFLIFVLIAILLMRSEEKQHKYYSSFWVEAVPILWWIIL